MSKSMKIDLYDAIDTDESITYNRGCHSKSIECSNLLDNSILLMEAAKQGNDTLVVKLLNAGVPSYITDQLGCNPFFYAARYNHVNILKILLNTGVLINVVTKMGRTALQIAAYHGHTGCVKFLLDNGANVNLVDSLGMSALHWSSENGHPECVKLLLNAGADTGLVNKFGKTAFILALKKSRFEICKMLREYTSHCTIDENSEFLLSENSLDHVDKEYRPYTAVFIPDRKLLYTGQTVSSIPISSTESKNDDQNGSTYNAKFKQDDTIKLFEQHGIKLLPVDQSTIIASALKRGQTAVLTEAGKLALKKTEPNIIRKIASMSNNLNAQPPAKKLRTDDDKDYSKETVESKTTSTKIDNVDIPTLSKAKVIKIDAKQLVNLAANKKLIISRPKSVNSSSVSEVVTQTENINSKLVQKNDCSTIKELENQLKKKTSLLQDIKKQLDLSLKLAKHYKSRYEVKEREAALYKTQLANLSKMLMKSGFKISAVQS